MFLGNEYYETGNMVKINIRTTLLLNMGEWSLISALGDKVRHTLKFKASKVNPS